MRSGVTILAGLATGVIVAIGILAAFVFVGPDPVGLRPTPTPTLLPTASPSIASESVAPSASASTASNVPSASASSSASARPSIAPSGVTPSGSDASQAGLRLEEPAPPLAAQRLGPGTIDLTDLATQP